MLPDEPAAFSYDVQVNLGLSVIPVIHICRNLDLYVELGLTLGDVEEQKNSSVRSSYDFDDWVTGYVWGFGLGFMANDRVGITAQYRNVDYDDFVYKSFLPDGSHWETITDSPRSGAYSVSVFCTF